MVGGSLMQISDIVTQYILKLLDESDGDAQIKRNELASFIGCVPSQINYVITSRFTPEHGYLVESRRGGGGYIRIIRINTEKTPAIRHIINSIGREIDFIDTEILIKNMEQRDIITEQVKKLMLSVLSDRTYSGIPNELRGNLRASLLKNMLLTLI